MLDQRIEIPIGMQELMAALDAERADDHVDRLPDRNATRPQQPIVSRGLDRDCLVQHWHHWILTQVSFDSRRMRLIAGTLQHLQQDQVADKDLVVIRIRQRPQPQYSRMVRATEQPNPD